MENNINDETSPLQIEDEISVVDSESSEIPSDEAKPQKGKRFTWIRYFLIAFVGLIGIASISAYLGYQSGIDQRTSFEAQQVSQAVVEQYKTGVLDYEDGNYQVARQRFEYVIRLNPSYPGITDMLANVLLALNITATPTLAPTVTPLVLTPTPDLRGEAELFAQAKDFIFNKEWSLAIETLESLRKKNPDYNAIHVDGMLYASLRNRGVEKISLGDLEEGIYDLNLAEAFGPLDTESVSWRTWSRFYILGASFWGIDWGQAAYFFGQVAPMTPNLHDGSFWTASERYLEALIEYGDVLADRKEWCNAKVQFEIALDMAPDENIEEYLKVVDKKCKESKDEKPKPTKTPDSGDS